MEAEIRRSRRSFRAVMAAAVVLAVLPSVVVLLYTGAWFGPGRLLLFLGLAGALVYTGAESARWGLAAWFGLVGLFFLLAAFVGAALSTPHSIWSVAPHILAGVLYVIFAVIFARSFGMAGWLADRRRRAGGPGGAGRT